VVGSEVTADGVKLSLEGAKGGSAETFDAEVVLVAIGRRPFTKNIGLEEVVRISCRKTDQPAACSYIHIKKKVNPRGASI
jgi:pyruvate/2-oxoglutarate dehydrogenase complex dihydrolipoamide dehydrogenase (E3) component